jgi:O-antigen/teichoic acid export membrane protein
MSRAPEKNASVGAGASSHEPAGATATATEPASRDVLVAVRNALILGASLLATWSVGLLVRLFLPRILGPERFGVFTFADSFAAISFVALGLGVETYIQKEIPVRPGHASDFFGGIVALRLVMSALVFAGMMAVLTLAHRPPAVQRLVFVFGAAQFLLVLNGNLAALLHARRTVGELAVVNVAAKVLWGLGVGLSLLLHTGLLGLAVAFFAAELARTIVLVRLVRRHVGLRLVCDARAVKAVVVACLPFYLSQAANTVYAKIDIGMLAALSNDAEVGWYGSAANLAALSFLIAPLIGWVLLPLLSRAAVRSEAEMFAIFRWTVRVLVLLTLPLALCICIGADVWVRGLFGATFAPATLSLRILAPVLVLTYLAMLASTCLVLLGRAWTVTGIALAGLVVDPILDFVLVPRGIRWLGPGGGGAGAATACVLAEAATTVALFVALGPRAVDRTLALAIGKALSCCLLVAAADVLIRPLGPARLAIDAAAYASLLFAARVVKADDVHQALALIRGLRPRSG